MNRTRSDVSPWQNEANVVACTLRAAGIPAIVADWHFISIQPNLEFGSSRPRVLIPPACVDDARDWLAAVQETSHDPIHPCPSCGGQTRPIRRWFFMALITALGTFHPFFSRRRRCGPCRLSYKPAPPAPFTEEELGYPPDDGASQRGLIQSLRTAGMNGAYGRPDP